MKKYFITGLIILLPLALTIWIIVFIVNFLTKPFMGVVVKIIAATRFTQIFSPLLSPEQVVRLLSQISILVGFFLLTLIIGFVTQWFFFKAIIRYSDKLLHKIPIVNKVYKTSQEIINTLFVIDKNSFKQVVIAPFPNPESYCLGLVSRPSPKCCKKIVPADLISVFIPTTPNPTSGFLLMYPREDLIFLKMKTEEALKYVVSCGVITPKKEEKKI